MSGENGDDGKPGEEPASDAGGTGGGQPPEGADQSQGGQAPGGQPRGEAGQPQGGRAQGGQSPQGQPQGGQPQQGAPPQGQPPQGGGARGPPQGQPPVRRGPSTGQRIQAALGEYAVKNQLKAVVGLWAVIGFGLGLTLVLLGTLGPGGALVAGSIGVGLVFGAGPIIGGLVGLDLSTKLPVEPGPAAAVSAVANFVGFVVMVIVFAILGMVAAAVSGGVGSVGGGVAGNFGDLLLPLFLVAIPIAITAGGATALGRFVDYPATREEAEAQEPPAPVPRRGPAPQQPQGPQ